MRAAVVAAIIAAFLSVAYSKHVFGHSWYEPACCSGDDCFEVEGKTLGDGRYLFIVRGQEFIKTKAETRQGLDDQFHACWPKCASAPICFYRPFAGS